jgi:hypothetical protein
MIVVLEGVALSCKLWTSPTGTGRWRMRFGTLLAGIAWLVILAEPADSRSRDGSYNGGPIFVRAHWRSTPLPPLGTRSWVGQPWGLGRVLINPILHTAAADVRFAPKATELLRRHEMT